MKQITLYVPTQTQAQKRANATLGLNLVNVAGGYTRYAHEGAWKDGDGSIFEEVGVTYVVLCSSPLTVDCVVLALREYGEAAGERTVAYTVEEVDAHFESTEVAV